MSLLEMPSNDDECFHTENLTDDTKVSIHPFKLMSTSADKELNKKAISIEDLSKDVVDEEADLLSNMDTSDTKSKFGWDNYWDKLESNVLGQPI